MRTIVVLEVLMPSRRRQMLGLVAALIVAAAGCPVEDPEQPEGSPTILSAAGVLETQDEAMDIVRAALVDEEKDLEQRRQAAELIAMLPGVLEAGVSEDEINIWIQYAGGQEGLLLLNPEGTRGGGSSVPTTVPPERFADHRQVPVGGTKVLIWAPFATEFEPNNEGPLIEQMLNTSTCPLFDVTSIKDDEADVASVQTFTNYDTVYMITHGALISSGEIVFLTSEDIDLDDETRALDVVATVPEEPPSYESELTVSTLSRHVYAIRPSDVEALPGEFENTLIYNASCTSAGNETMANAFLNKGAKSYFGYTRTVRSDFAAATATSLFAGLLQRGENAKQAFDAVDPKKDFRGPYFAELVRYGEEALVYPCLVGARLTIDGGLANQDWTLPAVVTMSMLDSSRDVFLGSSICTEGETGNPFWSESVPGGSLFYPVRRMDDPVVPRDVNEMFPLRNQSCTNFIATQNIGRGDEEIYLVAGEWPVDPGNEYDDEYQVRFSQRKNPDGTETKTCVVGTINDPYDENGGDAFEQMFEANCSIDLFYGMPRGDGEHPGTPSDDIELQPEDESVVENDSGITPLTFEVTLSGPPSAPITVGYFTTDLTATEGEDYVGISGELTFEADQLTQTVSVDVMGDTQAEDWETFALEFIAVSAGVKPAPVTGTILDDDGGTGPPALTLSSPTISEGDEGQQEIQFSAWLSEPSIEVVTADWNTFDLQATVADGDYEAASGSLVFEIGDTHEAFTVVVHSDLEIEENEQFQIQLSNVQGPITVPSMTTIGIISNDDLSPEFSIENVGAIEGNDGVEDLVFTVALNDAYADVLEVDVETRDLNPGPNAAAAGEDYVQKAATLVFEPGTRELPFVVTVVGDLVDENDEDLEVRLSNSTPPAIIEVNTALGSILDDDGVTWGDPVLIENDEDNNAVSVSGRLNESGDALITWRQGGQIRASGFTASGLLPAVDVGTASNFSPSTSLDEDGNVMAIWNSGTVRYSQTTLAQMQWSALQNVSDESPTFNATLATNSVGDAIAAWRVNGTEAGIYASRHVGGQWLPSMLLAESDYLLGGPRVGLDDAGNAFLIWNESDGLRRNLHARRFDSNAAVWSEEDLIDNYEFDVTGYVLEVTGGGDAVVALMHQSTNSASAAQDIWALRFSLSEQTSLPDAEWPNPRQIESSFDSCLLSGLAVSGDKVFVVWRQRDDQVGLYDAWANVLEGPVSGWGDANAERLETIDLDVQAMQVEADSSGRAIVVWAQRADETRHRIRAIHYENGAFGQAFNLQGALPEDTNLGDSLAPNLSMNNAGQALVVWQETTSVFDFFGTLSPIRSAVVVRLGD